MIIYSSWIITNTGIVVTADMRRADGRKLRELPKRRGKKISDEGRAHRDACAAAAVERRRHGGRTGTHG